MVQSLKKVFLFISGFVFGIVILGFFLWRLMPGMMLTDHVSRYTTVEETCNQLELAIKANGWESPGVRDMNKAIGKRGFSISRNVKIVELCKAQYARDVLSTNPEVSTLMPCAWGVYQGDDGKIHISGMNMGLMAKIFGGNIAHVMGDFVAAEEHRILKDVIVK